ncbi:MAG TPA: acylphosphatase [Cellulomonas sp.]
MGGVIARRAVVRGDVQGVGYRWWAAREAARLGVRGWVANRDDGAVEVHAEGDAAAIDALVAALHDGPRWARVARVVVTDADAAGWVGFEVEP